MLANITKRSIGNAFLNRYKELIAQSSIMTSILPNKFTNTQQIDQLGLKETYYLGSNGMDYNAINEGFLGPMNDLLTRPGKQWRPALMLMVAEGLGKDIENYKKHEDLYFSAGLCELIHNASLISDDMEDSSEMRRGDKCLHLKYGIDVAVNATTFLFLQPMTKISKYVKQYQKEYTDDCIDESCRLHLGQCMDIVWHKSNIIPTELQYMQMVSNKTGVNPRLAMKLIKHLYNQELTTEQKSQLPILGEKIGIAFQIVDDILNIKDTLLSKGKGIIGDDIREGKRTLMVIHSIKTQKSKEKSDRLMSILGMHTGNVDLINEAIKLMIETDSIEYASQYARNIMSECKQSACKLLLDNRGRQDLISLMEFIQERIV